MNDVLQAIVAENLVKTYRNGTRALDGLGFHVRRGEIYGLLGPNGAGKSTTTRILATLALPDAGAARVAGHDVLREAEEVRRRIGYVAQESGVDRHATGRENLMLQARLKRVPSGEVAGRVRRLLEWIGLDAAADRLVRTYSGGMRRRLDLAMGLVNDPDVLFLDEPTTGLDPETRAALWRDLARLREERGLTVLLTTHYLDEADHLCGRVAIVDRGRIVVEGAPAELKARIRGETATLEADRDARGLVDAVRRVEGVLDAAAAGETLVVRVASGPTAVPALVSAVERAGAGVRRVTLSQPSLDDVYLHHTGHRFVAESAGQQNGASGRRHA